MNGINKARKIRNRLASSVDFFISSREALDLAGDYLEWKDIEELPEWYMWNEDRLQQLVLVAGTVFLLPAIKLWIEAKYINVVKELIGSDSFEFIMQYTLIENSPKMLVDMDDIQGVLKMAGASVILSSVESRLHPWLVSKLPEARKQLNMQVANELLNHTLFVLKHTDAITGLDRLNDNNKEEGTEDL